MIQFLFALCLGVSASIIGVTINLVLAKEKIINWWFVLGSKIGKITPEQGAEQERWFYRPIWGCEKCFSGQIAFWTYICMSWGHYHIFFHLLTVCIAIMVAVILSHIIKQITDEAI